MTPLITELVQHAPEPEAFMWFDVGHLARAEDQRIPVDIIMHPPFPRTAMCATDMHGVKMAICLIAGDNSVTVAGFRLNPFNVFRPFAYMLTDQGIRYYMGKEEISEDFIKPAFKMVVVGLLRIFEGSTGHQPKAANTFINRKRAAKGKRPLSFDWHTVKIEPPQPKGESLGGSHASPRLHDRRGHWRKLKTKTVWVKSCKVGDASKGAVFKDYEITERTA